MTGAAAPEGGVYMGIDVNEFAPEMRSHFAGTRRLPPVIRLGI
jgi:hypothetical protein